MPPRESRLRQIIRVHRLSGYTGVAAGFQIRNLDTFWTAVGRRKWRLVCPKNVRGGDIGV